LAVSWRRRPDPGITGANPRQTACSSCGIRGTATRARREALRFALRERATRRTRGHSTPRDRAATQTTRLSTTTSRSRMRSAWRRR